jgi:hypothetical protein
MGVFIVTYDLRRPGKDYEPLLKAIRRYTHCHALKSAFFIDTTEDRLVIRDKLKAHVDENDQLYVMKLAGDWATTRSELCTQWLQRQERNWN